MNIILILFILILLSFNVCVKSQVVIQTGLNQLNLNNISSGSFTIIYQNSMPNANYNNLVNIGFVDNYKPKNGINIFSSCSTADQTQTSIKCNITASNGNNNNIVYLTFIVSNHGNLLIGSFQKSIIFSGIETSKATAISQNLRINPTFFNNTNAALIQSMIFISGINSFDPDFSLTISAVNLNVATSRLQFSVNLTQVHITQVKISFSFLIYDPRAIIINMFSDLSVVPGNVQTGILYGIYQINRVISNELLRLLQVVPSAKQQGNVIQSKSAQNIPQIIYRGPKNQNNEIFIASSTANKVGDTNYDSRQAKIIPKCFNPIIYNRYSDQKGIIDYWNPGYDIVATKGLCESNQQKSRRIVYPDFLHFPGATASVAPLQTQFNSLFSTNGFVILTTADDLDPIYYFQVTPVQQLESNDNQININSPVRRLNAINYGQIYSNGDIASDNPKLQQIVNEFPQKQTLKIKNQKPIFIQSIVQSKIQPIQCYNGNLISKMQKINFFQYIVKIICLRCQYYQIFNLDRRQCIYQNTRL